MRELVLVSGGFDPIHSGHIFLIQEASKYGDVIVLLNSDQWLREKKGREFLPFAEREIIMKSLKNVIYNQFLRDELYKTFLTRIVDAKNNESHDDFATETFCVWKFES